MPVSSSILSLTAYCLGFFGVFLCLTAIVAPAEAQTPDPAQVNLTLQNHHFAPAEVTAPAGAPIRFTVTNMDSTPAEFESDDFKGEKTLPTGQAVTITVAPLKAGTYEFHDEFNEDESKAKLIVQ